MTGFWVKPRMTAMRVMLLPYSIFHIPHSKSDLVWDDDSPMLIFGQIKTRFHGPNLRVLVSRGAALDAGYV
jgi:hypothetical protein